ARLSRRHLGPWGKRLPWGTARPPQAYSAGESSSARRTPPAVAVHSAECAAHTGPDDKARLRRPQSKTEEVRYEERDDTEHHAGHGPCGSDGRGCAPGNS